MPLLLVSIASLFSKFCSSQSYYFHAGCLRKRQFNFPNANQTTDYAYYNSTLSNMPESTVCFWAEMSSTPNNTCLLSYAVSGENNELSVFYSAGKIKTFYSGQEKTWRASFSHSHNQVSKTQFQELKSPFRLSTMLWRRHTPYKLSLYPTQLAV